MARYWKLYVRTYGHLHNQLLRTVMRLSYQGHMKAANKITAVQDRRNLMLARASGRKVPCLIWRCGGANVAKKSGLRGSMQGAPAWARTRKRASVQGQWNHERKSRTRSRRIRFRHQPSNSSPEDDGGGGRRGALETGKVQPKPPKPDIYDHAERFKEQGPSAGVG